MEDPNLIATLIPVDSLTTREFNRPTNDRCLSPIGGFDDKPVIGSREATPASIPSPPKDNDDDYENEYRLLLTFDKPPKDLTKGFTFGTDAEKCDVVLASRGVRQTSGVHFHIKFDVINGKRRLVLRDCSFNGSAVSYNGQAGDEVRRHFTWILDLEKRDREGRKQGEWDIEVHVRKLTFKVKLASHETSVANYNDEMDKFLEHSRTDDTPFNGSGNSSLLMEATRDLNVDSNLTSVAPSQSETPRRRRVYISERNVGRGSFGKVDKVIEVSTGAIYARKTFFDPGEYERKRWLDRISREVRIMKEYPHEHMIKLEDYWEKPTPFLVMPYLHLGNLENENSRSPITEGEAVTILFQGLLVLEHLHSRGVAHRDLKSDNILVEIRSPLRVQFTDFGLANDQPDLQTFCGTEQYAAPEIFMGEKYTASIDIWSLGVIVLEYIYGFPTQHSRRKTTIKERALAWCRRLIEYANDWDSDRLMDLLVTAMLQMQPQERLSAEACLRKGYEPPASAVCHEEEAPTVILDGLWDVGRLPANYNDDGNYNNDQEERSASDCHSTTRTSKFRQLDVPGSQDDDVMPQPRKETSRDIPGRSSGHVRSFGSKRHRSPAVNSPSNPSNESQFKRRAPESRLSKVDISGAEEDLTPLPEV
ncbi:MAG: hypothetical protein M1814_006940 [Vezdaea aestivalis]|nr:MAG: hypothetical protein M1814_006940 [Vezdaea aestivalis]